MRDQRRSRATLLPYAGASAAHAPRGSASGSGARVDDADQLHVMRLTGALPNGLKLEDGEVKALQQWAFDEGHILDVFERNGLLDLKNDALAIAQRVLRKARTPACRSSAVPSRGRRRENQISANGRPMMVMAIEKPMVSTRYGRISGLNSARSGRSLSWAAVMRSSPCVVLGLSVITCTRRGACDRRQNSVMKTIFNAAHGAHRCGVRVFAAEKVPAFEKERADWVLAALEHAGIGEVCRRKRTMIR